MSGRAVTTADASCSSIAGATSPTYVIGHGDVGTTLRVVVSASNAAGSAASPASAATAVVAPLAPSNTSLPAISGTTTDGQILSASTGGWTGTPPLTYLYQWQRCNTSGGSCANVSGATSTTYSLSPSDVGATLRVIVTASNAANTPVSATSPASGVIAAAAPVNTTAPSVTGSAVDGQTLSASTGSWSGTAPLSYAYQWLRCDASGGTCSTISGATASTYTLTDSDLGSTIEVQVTATNAAGGTAAVSAPTTVVTGSPPVNAAPPVVSGNAQDGQVLSASTGSWSGAAPLSYRYEWQGCASPGSGCTDITGATGATYTVGAGDVGRFIEVTVVASNAQGNASASSQPTGLVQPVGQSGCTAVWLGSAGDNQWTTAGNWSANAVPSASDTACLGAGTNVIVGSGTSQLATVIDAGALSVAGGSLEIDGSAPSQITSLAVGQSVYGETSSSVLRGSGEVDVSQTFTWVAGTISGTGALVIEPAATGTVNREGNATLDTRQLTNEGLLNWGASPASANGGSVRNEGVFDSGGGAYIAVPFDNEGAVNASPGGLDFEDGTVAGVASSGSWTTTASNASITFDNGQYTFASGVALSGQFVVNSGALVTATAVQGSNASLGVAGTLELDGPGVSVLSGLSVGQTPNGYYNSARVTGSGSIDVQGTLQLSAGTMTGSGTVTLAAGASGSIGGGTLDARQLNNQGSLTCAQGSLTLSDGATITNNNQMTVSGCLLQQGTGAAAIENAAGATLTAVASSSSSIVVPFDNQGSVNAGTGVLQFTSGGVASESAGGSWSAVAPGRNALQAGAFQFAPNVTVSGPLQIEGATLTASALQAQTGSVSMQGTGTLELDGATSQISALSIGVDAVGNQGGGTLTGSGEVDVTASLNWVAGAMSGTGETLIDPSVQATIAPPNTVTLDKRTLVNDGTINWTSGEVIASDGAAITNNGNFNANENGGYGLDVGIQEGTGTASFQNGSSGEVQDTSGAYVGISIPFDNQGTVSDSSGVLNFGGGGISGESGNGSWSTTSGATIGLGGGQFNLGVGAAVNGILEINAPVSASGLRAPGGEIDIQGGALSVGQGNPSFIGTLSVGSGINGTNNGAVLEGAGETEVTNKLIWDDGTIGSTGQVVIDPEATGTISPYAQVHLAGTELVNDGSLNWTSGAILGTANAELLNVGNYNATDDGPTATCPACTGMVTDTQMIGQLNPGDGALLVNQGTITDPDSHTNIAGVWWPAFNTGTIPNLHCIPTTPSGGSGEFVPTCSGRYTAGPGAQLVFEEWLFDATPQPAEQYGGGNDAVPNTTITGDDVDDGIGNESQSQTDINVGGLGVGLNLTRTYNSQVAAQQQAPGRLRIRLDSQLPRPARPPTRRPERSTAHGHGHPVRRQPDPLLPGPERHVRGRAARSSDPCREPERNLHLHFAGPADRDLQLEGRARRRGGP